MSRRPALSTSLILCRPCPPSRDEKLVTATPFDSALTNCDFSKSFRIRSYTNCRVSPALSLQNLQASLEVRFPICDTSVPRPLSLRLPSLSFQSLATIKLNYPIRIVHPEQSEGSLCLSEADTQSNRSESFQQLTAIKSNNSFILITIRIAGGVGGTAHCRPPPRAKRG